VIGDAVNLSAKLEKANKQLGARGVCDAVSYELALKQGYRPTEEKQRHAGLEIAGTAKPMDIVVVSA
jgi:adenylate cyclase